MLKNAGSGGDVAKFGRGLAVGCCSEVAMAARFSLCYDQWAEGQYEQLRIFGGDTTFINSCTV